MDPLSESLVMDADEMPPDSVLDSFDAEGAPVAKPVTPLTDVEKKEVSDSEQAIADALLGSTMPDRQKPEEKEEQEEDASETIEIEKAVFDELLAKLEASLAGQVPEPPQQESVPKAPPPRQAPSEVIAAIPEFDIDENEAADAGITDHKWFGKILTKATKEGANAAAQLLMGTVDAQLENAFGHNFGAHYAACRVMEDNPEYEKVPRLVASTMGEIVKENPGLTVAEAVVKLKAKMAKQIRKAQNITEQSKQKKVDVVPKRGQFAKGTTAKGAGGTKKLSPTEQANALINQSFVGGSFDPLA
jgi:hypothetical protein